MEHIGFIVAGTIAIGAISALVWREWSFRSREVVHETEVKRKLYELAILRRLGEGMGYSLDVEHVVGVVTGSLRQFIDYTTVSYMLLKEERIVFTVELNSPVSKKFIAGIREQMKRSLEVLLDRQFRDASIEEKISGALTLDGAPDSMNSYFNIPLVVDERVIGLLTVAHARPGMYTEEDMIILYKIVAQASQAVTKLEQVVKEEQAKLSAMVESMSDGVVMTDREYRVLVANPAVKRILGLENDPNIDIFDFVDSLDGRFDIKGKLEESIVRDTVITTHEVKIGDGFYKIVISPVKGISNIVKGRTLGGVIVFHDMTSERKAEKMREEFTSVMIHELRGPLDGIKKIGEIMHGDSVRTDRKTYDEYVRMIYDGSSRMLELVNDLLDVARIESGKLEISPRISNMEQVLQGRVRFFAVPAKDKGVDLRSSVAVDVPKEMSFDPIRIEQALNNLISNALKHTERGGAVAIHAFVHEAGKNVNDEAKTAGVEWFVPEHENERFTTVPRCVVVSVTDSGSGVSKEKIGTLFGAFDQNVVLEHNHKVQGFGLGLVIVKGVVEKHGGIVGVGSQEGKGSTFYFTINT